jgi:hypothetical protein
MADTASKIFFLVLLFSIILVNACCAQKQTCNEDLKNFLAEAPSLLQQGRLPQVDSALNKLEAGCGKNEYSIRLRHLMLINRGAFTNVDFALKDYQTVMSYLEGYRFTTLMDTVHEAPSALYDIYFGEPQLIFTFDSSIVNFATQILEKPEIKNLPNCDLRKTVLFVYSNDLRQFRDAITTPGCESRIAKMYQGQLSSVSKKALVDVALISGYWIPYGENKILGHHPSLGFLFGFGKKKMIYDLAMEFRFGRPKQPYITQYQGAPLQTRHYFGGYIGLDVGYELRSYATSKLYFLAGVAMDGFDAVKGSKTVKGKSLFSLNLNGGMGWRWFMQDGTYLGFELRHNFNHYTNPGGTDLSGNSLTGRLLIGLLKNDEKKRQTDYLTRLIKP